MRYRIENNTLVPVTKVTVSTEVPVTQEDIEKNPELEGQETRIIEEVVNNPTDAMIDSLKAGYEFIPEVADPMPEYDESIYNMRRRPEVIDDAYITLVWYTTEKTTQERIAYNLRLIEQANKDYEMKLSTPVEYTNGHTYKPEWVSMYYVPAIQYMEFPYPVESADSIVPTNMTKEELNALSAFLSGKVKDFLQEFHQTVDPLYIQIAQLQAEVINE